MILRKPYGFLIKYFKTLHLILTLLIAYLIYTTNKLLVFFNEYINSSNFVIGQELTESLFNMWMFIVPFLICLVLIILMIVMVIKKKPYLFYISNIVVYIFLLIMYNVVLGVLNNMETVLLDIRIIRAIRDVLMILWVTQAASVVMMFIRATGFDIKKFDFGQDLQELDISEEDREEFEVDFEFDTDVFRRNIRRRLRYLKYFYVERRFFINIATLITITLISFAVYMNSTVYNKTINEGVYFNANSVMMKVNKSYLTTKDYKGIKITDRTVLVVLDVSARSRLVGGAPIELGKSRLLVNDKVFYHTNRHRDRLTDLGVVYEDYELGSKDTGRYILVYEIPIDLMNEDMMFVYDDTNNFSINTEPRNIKVKLNLKNIDVVDKKEEFVIGEEINFIESIFAETRLKIDSVDIQNNFVINYNYCLGAGDCYQLKEYIRPNIYSNVDKALLKLVGTFSWGENASNADLTIGIPTFINRFGKIAYEEDGKIKEQSFDLKVVNPNKAKEKNTYYFEVTKEVKNSNKVELVFTIRDKEYRYRVK